MQSDHPSSQKWTQKIILIFIHICNSIKNKERLLVLSLLGKTSVSTQEVLGRKKGWEKVIYNSSLIKNTCKFLKI